VDTALTVVRFIHYTAAIQLFGTAVFETWVAPAALSDSLLSVSRRIAVASAWLLLLSAVAWLGLMGGSMGDGWTDTVDPGVLRLVLTATDFGHVWSVGLVLVVAAVIASHWLGPRRGAVLAVIALLSLGVLGLIGHAAAEEGAMGLLRKASQVVHLVSSGFWFGSLLPLVFCLRRMRAAERDVGAALRRFSGLGHLAVALALCTGVLNSWLILRDQPLSLASPYQALLLLKALLVGVMVVLAMTNRYVFLPRLPAGDAGARHLRNGTVAEIGVGSVVILLVSAFGIMSPA
jgi:putative copper resistance protein D